MPEGLGAFREDVHGVGEEERAELVGEGAHPEYVNWGKDTHGLGARGAVGCVIGGGGAP